MDVTPRFIFPWALTLLVLVPWSIWVGSRIHSLPRVRKWIAVTLRTFILLALIFALAGAELVLVSEKLAVFFLVDHSSSIPDEYREGAFGITRQLCETNITDKDEAGLIVFGDFPSIEQSMQQRLNVDEVKGYVGGERTDIAAAIRLAMAAFPQGHMKRIVLFTDGNETDGSAVEEVKLARANGIEVNVIPLDIGTSAEVRLRELNTPARVNADEPFKLQAIVEAEQDCSATLRIYQRVREGKRLLQSAEVTLQKGNNAFLLPQELASSGFYEYEATIESSSDTVFANNIGRAFTVIRGEPQVLYLNTDSASSPNLRDALVTEGLNVEEVGLDAFPTSLAGFQDYDAVVMANVSSTDLTSEQIRSLEAMVRDLGIGLVMVGGPESFGAGGYFDSAVERALPVSMDIKERKILPRGALCLIMHTCEIADGNAWAREIGLASLNVLASQDLLGALAYTWEGQDQWVLPLQLVGDKQNARIALSNTEIGDMPATGPTLQMAYDALAEADAAVKRIVVISDGDAQRPARGLVQKLIDAQISVSTVCINPHSLSDQESLQVLADATNGAYYFVQNPMNLPQIFTKEAATVKRGLLVEKEFTPQVKHDSELLGALASNGIPALDGYVLTTAKENAVVPLVSDEDDPIFAHWRYGLGKSVAFTSDVTGRWASDWLQWEEFNKFWAQTVRWATRDTADTNFQVDVRAEGSRGHIKIDAVDDEGRFVNFLKPKGVVTGPAPDFKRTEVALSQTAPGVYEGAFPINTDGTHMINLLYTREDGSQGMLPTGLAMGYSPEYEYRTSNLPLLEDLVAAGGGKLMSPEDNPFEHTLEPSSTSTPIWQYLVVFALCLFPIEIFVRRVFIDFMAGWLWLVEQLRYAPVVGRFIPEPTQRVRPLTGAFGAMRQVSKTLIYTAVSDASVEEAPAIEERLIAVEEKEAKKIERDKKHGRGSTEYTSELLAAKDRALKKRGVRDNKEEK